VIRKKIALAALGLVISGAASAQTTKPPMADERGFYVGGGYARSDFADSCRNAIAGFQGTCDENDSSYKLFAGYDFNRMFSAEIGYVDLGKAVLNGAVGATAASGTVEAKVYEMTGLLKLPITPQFSGFARLGFYRGDVDSRANIGAVGTSSSDSNTDLTFGAGLRFFVTRNIAVQGEWQRYNDVGSGAAGNANIDTLGVSVLFKF